MSSSVVAFGLFFVMNLALRLSSSSLQNIGSMRFAVSVPLTFVGAYFGFGKSALERPIRTEFQINRLALNQYPVSHPVHLTVPHVEFNLVLAVICSASEVELKFILNTASFEADDFMLSKF